MFFWYKEKNDALPNHYLLPNGNWQLLEFLEKLTEAEKESIVEKKADNTPTNTKESRARKGAYVDCLMLVKDILKNNPSSP